MRDGWRFIVIVNGGLFVMTLLITMKQLQHANNWDMEHILIPVIGTSKYYNYTFEGIPVYVIAVIIIIYLKQLKFDCLIQSYII